MTSAESLSLSETLVALRTLAVSTTSVSLVTAARTAVSALAERTASLLTLARTCVTITVTRAALLTATRTVEVRTYV